MEGKQYHLRSSTYSDLRIICRQLWDRSADTAPFASESFVEHPDVDSNDSDDTQSDVKTDYSSQPHVSQ